MATFAGTGITQTALNEENLQTLNVSKWTGTVGASESITITHGEDDLNLRRVTLIDAAGAVTAPASVTHSTDSTTTVVITAAGTYSLIIAL